MKRALIVHGWNSKPDYFDSEELSPSNRHWLPWLQKKLLMNGYHTQTPEMPEPHAPKYDLWRSEFELYKPKDTSILVGHSCGGGFLLRWLSENKTFHEHVVLVAPWLDPYREETTDFFEFEIDSEITDRTPNFHILISDDDEKSIADSFGTISATLPDANVHKFTDKGHFTEGDLKSKELPELLEVMNLKLND